MKWEWDFGDILKQKCYEKGPCLVLSVVRGYLSTSGVPRNIPGVGLVRILLFSEDSGKRYAKIKTKNELKMTL